MSPRLIMKLSVAEVRRDRGDVMVVTLKHPRRPLLPAFTAGAHVDVHLSEGRVRQYSLCNDPADASFYRLAIKREQEGRGGSISLQDHLAPGATLQVSAPRNHFALSSEATRHVLLAGGIGITPILAMSHALGAGTTPFEVHYFTRGSALTPLIDDIARLPCADRLSYHYDDDPGTRVDLAALLASPAPGTHLYCCGPSGFMNAVREAAAGWLPAALHFEAFQVAADEGFVAEPFTMVLRSGRRIEVSGEQTALQALRQAGIDHPSSCETGICATCECGYLEGEAIHRDAILSPQAKLTRFMPCVSRAKGTLKLDL
ncbi:MAG: 2Fe-2S iron-sulfur cluster binding domain-containing protein [Rhodospirillales bacterium]|nr:2Fe-2S iron-sulfur cluster binding domain-containing protein [Rhodospirillales bacterium]